MLGFLLGLVMAQEATASITPIPSVVPTPTPDPVITLINQYRQDYNFQLSEYQKKYIDYINKKEVYTKYRTIISEKDKIEAGKAAIFSRNILIRTYLLALRVHLDQFKTSAPSETEKIQIELSKWEAWADEQNLIVPNLNNQNDINNWIDDFKTKYIAIQTVTYTALSQNQINQRLFILNQIKKLSTDIKSNPATGDMLNDWLSSLPIKTDLVNSSLQKAKESTQVKQLSNRFVDFYPDVKIELNRADGYLKNMLSDLKAVAIRLNQ